MRSYFLPITFAAAGAAILIHYKSDQQKDLAARLPPMPRSSFVDQKVSRRTPPRSRRRIQTADLSGITPMAFKQGTITAKTNSVFDKPYEFFHERLLVLNQCLQTFGCPYPTNDPKEYEIQLHADVKTTLDTLYTWQKRHQLRDQRITDLMADFLVFEDAGVKQKALEILATQPPDRDVLEPILIDVIEYPQPEPIAAGMKELRRYHSAQDKIKIDNTLERVLRTGAVNAAEEVAKNLKPLIDAHNWNRYDKIRDDMARSPLSEDIYVALSEVLDN
jgi:hypothetical protein